MKYILSSHAVKQNKEENGRRGISEKGRRENRSACHRISLQHYIQRGAAFQRYSKNIKVKYRWELPNRVGPLDVVMCLLSFSAEIRYKTEELSFSRSGT